MIINHRSQLHRLTSYAAAIIFSSLIGYFIHDYIDNIVLLLAVISLLAVLFVQLFSMIIGQLRDSKVREIGQPYHDNTIQALANIAQRLSKQLVDKFGPVQAKVFFLVWPHQLFIEFNGQDQFNVNHSLTLAVKNWPQVIVLSDQQYFAQLPDVIALDVAGIMKRYAANCIVPLATKQTVLGYVFLKLDNALEQKSALRDLGMVYGAQLEPVLQHDAIIHPTTAHTTTTLLHYRVDWQAIIILTLFTIFSTHWIITNYLSSSLSYHNVFEFGNFYGLTALYGGLVGLFIAQSYKQQKNIYYGLISFSIGLILQEFGQLSYAVYNVVWNNAIPYPSVGDFGFFGSVIFYLLGIILFSRASGIALHLRVFKNQLLAILIPALLLLFGYLMFLQEYIFDWSDPLKIILDFGYPLFQAMYVAIALVVYLLIRKTAGVTRQHVLLIVVALIWQFICDYVFLYMASRGIWRVNGINDYMYLISYVLMSLALVMFIENKKYS